MSGGGNKTESVSTQTASLLPSAKRSLDTSLGAANKLYKSGDMFAPYTGSTVVPFSRETLQGMASTDASAKAMIRPLDSAFRSMHGIANGTGFNGQQNKAMATLQGLMSSAGSNSERNLGAYARGDMMGMNNPAFRAVVEQSQDAARDSVNMSASGMGRTGSGVHQGVMAKEIGDLTNRALAGQMNQDISNQFGANSAMDQQRLANLGISMQAAGDLFNAGQQGQSNRMNAAGMLPGAYNAAMMPGQTLMGLGSMKEDLAGRQMNDQMRIWQERQAQPRQAIEWLNAIGTGAGQLGGSSTTTSQTPKPSPFMTGLGGMVGGATVGGPVGGMIGGGLGLLGGMF